MERSTYSIESEKGGLAVLVAIMVFSLIGATALAIDIGMAKAKRVSLQAATDMGALAGIHKLSDPNSSQFEVLQEAQNIADANDLPANIPLPELGFWNGTSFITGSANAPNAVRVTASDTVTTNFGTIFGVHSLPAVAESVAAIGSPNDVSCVVPFGIEDINIEDRDYGDILDINRASAGNWGKIDIDGNMSSNPAFISAFTSGFCSTSVSLGDTFTSATGYAGVSNGFDQRLVTNPIVVMPVVRGFSSGNSTVSVVGFVLVKLIAQHGNGSRWGGTIQLLNGVTGNTISGGIGTPYAQGRGLVK